MRHLLVSVLFVFAVAGLLLAGCAPAAPAPTPTKAPAAPAPTKAAEPTKPAAATAAPTKAPEPTKPAAAPTAAPAKKVDWPQKGRAATWIAPWNAGGGTDFAARPMAEVIEKDLGFSINYVNRPGAGLQVGMTELALAKPDGYTIGYTTMPNVITIYLDPERKAAFKRESFAPIAMHLDVPNMWVVRSDSPWKTLKDLLDDAKARPEKITAATTGILGDDHMAILAVEKQAGVRFAAVHLTGMANKELLAGDVNVAVDNTGTYQDLLRANQVRVLGIMDRQRSPFYPGVPTFEEQGFKIYASAGRNLSLPAGTPREIVDIWAGAIKKVMEMPDYKKKMEEQGYVLNFMGPDALTKYWIDKEIELKGLMDMFKAQIK